MSTKEKYEHTKLAMVPIRDVVIFPFMMVPFVIGRESSVQALESALRGDKRIFLSTQHDATVDNPRPNEIYQVGTISNIVQSLKLPDGNTKVLVEGIERARILQLVEEEGFWKANLRLSPFRNLNFSGYDTLAARLTQQFEQYVKLSQNLNSEHVLAAIKLDDVGRLADTICAHMVLTIEEKQELIEIFNPVERSKRLADVLDVEIEKLHVDRSVQNRVKRQMERAQKEYYLNEKIKAIQRELGKKDEKSELEELRRKIETAGMPKDAFEKATQEMKRLEMMPPMSAESTVSRNYLDWLLAMPWKKKSREIRDIELAEKVLNEDHYGLEKIKDRILEFLAVRKLVKKPKGSILCFVGPPGVGKTSLGMSIARATGRKFVRLALGGVRDEAEIRGHRRTYIGALPGQILQGLRRAEFKNPVFILDEIDKLGSDFRGDPASALLEVLDPEQNNTFRDHYLDVPFDLSEVLFITTANVLDPVPPALRDRMEVLEIAGYTEEEKLQIATDHLVDKQVKNHGLTPEYIRFTPDALRQVIRGYTREAGVRNLEREIGSLCRKVARRRAEGNETPLEITTSCVVQMLGAPRFLDEEMEERTKEPGVAIGLAWTPAGGEVLFIEASRMAGTGSLTLTGQLGDVMKESARAALSWVRNHAKEYNIDPDFFKNAEIHVHVPSGAIPKDGPSAGVTMATAMASELTGRPVRGDIAMTGEITLSGRVLPIGGVKEKVLAARRVGISEVILPKQNGRNINEDLTPELRQNLIVHLVSTIDEVLALALQPVSSDVLRTKKSNRPVVQTAPPRM